MNRGGGHIHSGPGHAVRGTTGYSSDLLSLQALNQGGFSVNCGSAVPLLPMVIVTPCIHLTGNHNTLITIWSVVKESLPDEHVPECSKHFLTH